MSNKASDETTDDVVRKTPAETNFEFYKELRRRGVKFSAGGHVLDPHLPMPDMDKTK